MRCAAREPLLQCRVEIGKAPHGLVRHDQRAKKRNEGPGRGLAAHDAGPAVEDHRPDRDPAQHLDERRRQRPGPHHPEHLAESVGDDVMGAAGLVRLHPVSLDVPHIVHRLVEQRAETAGRDLGSGRGFAHAPAEIANRDDGDGEDGATDDGQTPILIEQEPDQKDQGDAVLGHAGERATEHLVQVLDVVQEVGDQLARGQAVEVGEVRAHQVGEQVALQSGDDALTDRAHQIGLSEGRDRLDQRDRDDRQRDHHQHVLVAAEEYLVENRLKNPGVERRAASRDHHEQGRQRHPRQMPAHILANQASEQYLRGGGRSRELAMAIGQDVIFSLSQQPSMPRDIAKEPQSGFNRRAATLPAAQARRSPLAEHPASGHTAETSSSTDGRTARGTMRLGLVERSCHAKRESRRSGTSDARHLVDTFHS